MITNRGYMPHFFRCMLIFLTLLAPWYAHAQQESEEVTIPLDHFYADPINGGLRNFFSKFHLTFSTGYGTTFYRQGMEDFAILQQQDSVPFIFRKELNINSNNVSTGYRYYFNRVEEDTDRPIDPANDFVVAGDTSELKFAGQGMSIPVNFMIHYEFDRYRIGAGMSFEYHRPGRMSPTVYSDRINSYEPDFNSTFYKKYYFMFGAKVYRYYYWVLSVDAHLGAFNLSRKFDKEDISKGIYFNIGPTIEREMSEYLRFFVRPSVDLKSYTLIFPETDAELTTRMNAFYVNVGITYRIPRLRRCFIKDCRTQVNHQHGNMEYRSRVHPFYKNQNPHHGENYPTLIKYKGKNKKKMNAY